MLRHNQIEPIPASSPGTDFLWCPDPVETPVHPAAALAVSQSWAVNVAADATGGADTLAGRSEGTTWLGNNFVLSSQQRGYFLSVEGEADTPPPGRPCRCHLSPPHVLWWEQRLFVLLSFQGWVRAGPERQLGAVGEIVPHPTFKNVL